MRTPPTPGELERLYRAAFAFHAAATWTHSNNQRFLAVENPETGVVGFVIAGEDLYDGLPGAMILRDAEAMRVHDALSDDGDNAFTDLFWRRNSVVIGFDAPGELAPHEYAIVESLGLLSSDVAPVFLQQTSGMIPLQPDAAAVRFAAIALEQAVESFPTLAERIAEDRPIDEFPVRVLVGAEWRDEWRSLDDILDADYGTPPAVRPEWKAIAKKIKRHTALWEFGAMLVPTQLDSNAGPELACLHMIVDGTEVIASTTEPHRSPERLCEFLVATIEHHKIKPKKLLVADPGLANAVSELARAFGIAVELVDYLPVVGPIYAETMDNAYGDGSDAFEDGEEDAYEDAELEDFDDADYEMPTGTRSVEMPAGFRRKTLVVNYDAEDDQSLPEPVEAAFIERALVTMTDDPHAGVNALREIIERFPSNEMAHVALMSTLASIGNDADARTAAERARTSFPESFEMRMAHVSLLVELGDSLAAIDVLGGASEITDLFPDRTEFNAGELLLFHTSLYRIHVELARFDDAARDLDVLRNILPGHPGFAMAAASHEQMKAAVGGAQSQ